MLIRARLPISNVRNSRLLPMPGVSQGSQLCLSGFFCPTKCGCRDTSKINVLKVTIHSAYQTQFSIVFVKKKIITYKRWFRTCGRTLWSFPNTGLTTGCFHYIPRQQLFIFSFMCICVVFILVNIPQIVYNIQ